MRVLFRTGGGGVRSYLTKMLGAASKRGHELIVVAPGPKDEIVEENGGRIIRYAGPPMPYDPTYHVPLRVDRMRSLVTQIKPDVLQVSSPFLPALVATTLKNIPLRTYVYHSDPINSYVRPFARRYLRGTAKNLVESAAWSFMRRVCNIFDATIVSGKWLERLLREKHCQNVHTIPFGFDRKDLGPDKMDLNLRQKLLGSLADEPEARLILICGRLAMDKRPLILIDSLVELSKKRPIALVIVGDGPEREAMLQRAAALPMVTIRPFTRDRMEFAKILASVDALLHGSLSETFGFVLVEALASGTPVVVPQAGGASELVNPNCSEIYDEDATAYDIASAVARLLKQPQKHLSETAVKVADKHPSFQSHFDVLFDFYRIQLQQCGFSNV